MPLIVGIARLARAWRRRPTSSRCARPGGISAWLVQEKSLPIIAIRFAFDGGSAQEPAGKEGTAGLLAAMLDQGAGNLSGAAYQKQMEKLAARISFDSRPRHFLRQLRDADRPISPRPANC